VAAKCFFDLNILLYLIERDDPRTAVAKKLVDAGGTISVQVLNEFANVATKKPRMSPGDIIEVLMPVRDACDVVAVDLATHDRAMEILSTTNLGVYDATIVAAADLAGCETVYSEDMNHGQRIGRVEIRNPFK
jgi:predicted nucleic acid-binding protein